MATPCIAIPTPFRLAALTVDTLADEFDQSGPGEGRDDAVRAGAGQVREARKVRFRGLPATTQRQQQALAMTAHRCRMDALARMRTFHESPPTDEPVVQQLINSS